MGIDIHAGIQSRLTILIEEAIKAKRPLSENFKIIKMYTEKIDDQKIMAHFSYEFQDQMPSDGDNTQNEKTLQKISGTAVLSKGLSEDPTIQKWILQSVKTAGETIDFKDGLTITSDGKTTEDSIEKSVQPAENK